MRIISTTTLVLLLVSISTSYPLTDLLSKLNSYDKAWISGVNNKFKDLPL